jgi:hypothetical protein
MVSCVRSAWLVLGNQTVLLDNPAGGWFCTSLDLGYPAVREVTDAKPDMNGTDDRTSLMGARVVQADITALAGAGAQIDAVAAGFAPFMNPAARPVLHYTLDRPGAAERTLTLRAANYSWPIVGPVQRDVQLQWVAADPIARDPTVHTAIAYSGPFGSGRLYNLVFPRTYPAGGGTASAVTVSSPGDVPIRPLIRIYGPVTKPQVVIQAQPDGTYSYFTFLQSFVLSSTQWVDIDSLNRTVYRQSDPRQNAIAQVDWVQSTWPYIPPLPSSAIVSFNGQSTSGITQAQVIWQDGYLT